MPPLTHWLGVAARQAREASGRTLMDMVTASGMSQPTISRFERGASGVSRRATEALAEVYERELGLDPLELWKRAMELAGEPPPPSGT